MTKLVKISGTNNKSVVVDDGTSELRLFSYETHVATFDTTTLDWVWITDNPYHLTRTTRRHINACAREYNLPEYKA